MIHTLVKDKKLEGKYIALPSLDDSTIVGVGESPATAYEQARSKGYDNPVITFVPTKDMVQIY